VSKSKVILDINTFSSDDDNHRRFFMPRTERSGTVNKNMIDLPRVRLEKQIGGTTFIVTTGFNGDKNHDVIKSFLRMIERDSLSQPD